MTKMFCNLRETKYWLKFKRRQQKVTKVLEQCWDTNADELFFDFTELIEYAKSLPITKHSVLKFGSKIFDPLSFLSLFTVRVKILLQQLSYTGSLGQWIKRRLQKNLFETFQRTQNIKLHSNTESFV